MLLLETVLFLFVSFCLQSPVNRIAISTSQGAGSCSLRVLNTQEILDLRSDCPLDFSSSDQVYITLLRHIKANASYLIKDVQTVKGYRYFKDVNNYKFKEYDFEGYHRDLQRTIEQLGLSPLALPFEERYEMVLSWHPAAKLWRLLSLSINLTNPVHEVPQLDGYEVTSWLEPKTSQKSIALRKLAGKGPNQAVNLTLELAMENDTKIQPKQCKVVIEEILPQWFFVDYDFLHTLVKYEVFDIELPQHFSKQYFFKYTVPFTKFKKVGRQTYTYQYKIGVRYPRPTNDGSYFVQVGLHPNDRITIECEGEQSMEVVQDLLNDRGHGTMFAGREQDAKRVTMVTYLVTTVLSVIAIKAVKIPKQLK